MTVAFARFSTYIVCAVCTLLFCTLHSMNTLRVLWQLYSMTYSLCTSRHIQIIFSFFTKKTVPRAHKVHSRFHTMNHVCTAHPYVICSWGDIRNHMYWCVVNWTSLRLKLKFIIVIIVVVVARTVLYAAYRHLKHSFALSVSMKLVCECTAIY